MTKTIRLKDAPATKFNIRWDEYVNTKMPFGKHKGKWISEIPDDYLKWGITKCDNYIATMFSIELQRRYPKLRK